MNAHPNAPVFASDVLTPIETDEIARRAFDAALQVLRQHGLDPDGTSDNARAALWWFVKDCEVIVPTEIVRARLAVVPVEP